jgi:hypothetical protein
MSKECVVNTIINLSIGNNRINTTKLCIFKITPLNIHARDDVSYRTVVHVAIIKIKKKLDISSLKA